MISCIVFLANKYVNTEMECDDTDFYTYSCDTETETSDDDMDIDSSIL